MYTPSYVTIGFGLIQVRLIIEIRTCRTRSSIFKPLKGKKFGSEEESYESENGFKVNANFWDWKVLQRRQRKKKLHSMNYPLKAKTI